MKGQIAPSVMCVDFLHLKETLRELEALGMEYLHVDIMDGSFVPNYTLGPDFCRALKRACKVPLDIHLMVTEPERKLSWFPIGGGDCVSVHYESTPHPLRALQAIRALGAKPMLALGPMTPVSVLEHALGTIDGVLIMTVNPGFAGQQLVPGAFDKLAKARAFLDAHGGERVRIEVDGNVSFENAIKMRAAGADIFVAGTSSIFSPGAPLGELTARLRACIE
ncbi:ribulose-phosphate 3-epimerase [Bacillota bacterium Meth-B3]|nr:ribulose-phosphate 3-epimerase [Christensenellaceae bacterium]MEA5065003.1 ribulose-phosphate 3-epimerase [Eubacteriales bacterium]MEA5068837.1 ribulose-phosphate 3-epimerase [Christensenellaceae bacterium]